MTIESSPDQQQWQSVDQKNIKGFLSTGRHQECLQACQQLLQTEPENPLPWKFAGKSLLALGQFEKAQQCLAKAHQLDGSDPEIVKDIGNIFNALQNDAEAIKLYKAALSIDQNYAPAINNLGLIAKRQGNLATAEQLVKRACNLDQSFAPYYINLGSIYKDLGNLDQALASTLKSLELKPDNPDVHMNLGGIYKDLGNLDQALASTLKSLELKPDNPTAHMNLGGIYKDLGQLDQALSSTLKSLELKPDNPDAHINLGGIYKELGQLDQALASTLKSLKLKPDNPDAHINLGGIYGKLGDLDQALASTLKSLEFKPDNPDVHMNLGGIYKDLGNLDQALASTLKSLELKPDNPTAHMNLGGIYQSMGDMEDAAESLQKALAINPHLPGALYMSSITLKDVDNTHLLLEKIEEVDQTALPLGDKVKIAFAKSNCFHKEKNYENASTFLKEANELKLMYMPSDADILIENIHAIKNTLPANEVPTREKKCDKIFIVGVPRSGSTLLSAILNTNHLIKDLGESRALPNALEAHSCQDAIHKGKSIEHFYTNCIDEAMPQGGITVDKQLRNFMHCHYVVNHMPGAKIIHSTRNPLDNILSMLRANLIAGNNFTASAEDSAMVIIEQEKLMRDFKKQFPHKIYTYSHDKLVNDPQTETQKLLAWLGLDWSESYLDFHKTKQVIKTASVLQARQPISNKSVGGWKNYSVLLEPARQLLLDSNLFSVESLC